MKIDFDPAKDVLNQAKHGISLKEAALLEWDTALLWFYERKDYGEPHQCAIAYIDLRLYHVRFVDRDEVRRIISLRKANRKEVNRYAEA